MEKYKKYNIYYILKKLNQKNQFGRFPPAPIAQYAGKYIFGKIQEIQHIIHLKKKNQKNIFGRFPPAPIAQEAGTAAQLICTGRRSLELFIFSNNQKFMKISKDKKLSNYQNI